MTTTTTALILLIVDAIASILLFLTKATAQSNNNHNNNNKWEWQQQRKLEAKQSIICRSSSLVVNHGQQATTTRQSTTGKSLTTMATMEELLEREESETLWLPDARAFLKARRGYILSYYSNCSWVLPEFGTTSTRNHGQQQGIHVLQEDKTTRDVSEQLQLQRFSGNCMAPTVVATQQVANLLRNQPMPPWSIPVAEHQLQAPESNIKRLTITVCLFQSP